MGKELLDDETAKGIVKKIPTKILLEEIKNRSDWFIKEEVEDVENSRS